MNLKNTHCSFTVNTLRISLYLFPVPKGITRLNIQTGQFESLNLTIPMPSTERLNPNLAIDENDKIVVAAGQFSIYRIQKPGSSPLISE